MTRPDANPTAFATPRRWSWRAVGVALAVLALLPGCDDAAATFEQEAAPVLARRCAAPTCHGVSPDAEARGEVLDWSTLLMRVDAYGRLDDLDAARRAALRAANTAEDVRFSSLLRKAIGPEEGGQPHAGGAALGSLESDDARALRRWLAREDAGAGGERSPPLQGPQALFASTVEPLLLGRGCALGNCHGPQSPVPFRLDPGVAAGRSRAVSRANHVQAKVMLALDGDPSSSRLLRKALAPGQGGLPHRAGAVDLAAGVDGPLARAIRAWACAERAATTTPCPPGVASGAPSAPGADVEEASAASVQEILVTAVPRGSSAPDPGGGDAVGPALFALGAFVPGTRVVRAMRQGGGAFAIVDEVSAAACAGGPCDARDVALDAAGDRAIFAVQRAPTGPRLLWQRELPDGPTRQLTFAPEGDVGAVHDRDPCVGPGGRVYFVSDRARGRADDGGVGSELFELDPTSMVPRQRTFSPHRVRWPSPFRVGLETAGTVGVTLLRDVIADQRKAHPFRFAPDLHTELHQHFGVSYPFEAMIQTVEIADGRYVATTLPLAATDTLGGLIVVDRNLGPSLPGPTGVAGTTTPPSLPGYLPPFQRLDLAALGLAAAGEAHALPGLGLLVSARSPVAPGASQGPAWIALLQLGHDHQGRVTIASAVPWLAADDADLRGPVARWRRAPSPPVGPERADAAAASGLLVHQGVPMIDAILAHLPPTGVRPARQDLVAVRLLEPLDVARAPLPAGAIVGASASASTAGLGPQAPVRLLGTLPLAADGSFQAAIPPSSPVRLQAVASDGLAAGLPHNRWLHGEPGQRVPQGVAASPDGPYRATCAVCHGAADGDPTASSPMHVDLVTSASWTLSRYDGGDPRRPLAPPELGVATRSELDFRADVRPILDARCATAGCHDAATRAGDLRLDGGETAWFDVGYEALLARGEGSGGGFRYVDATHGRARASHLAERLLGRELEAPRPLPPGAGPHGALSEAERATLLLWMDLGATFLGSAAASGSAPGGAP